MKDYYKILEIPHNASQDDIKRAYRRMAMKWHPDRNNVPEATEKFKEINAAYEYLIKNSRTFEYQRKDRAEDFWGLGGIKFDFRDIFNGVLNSDYVKRTSSVTIDFEGAITENDIMAVRKVLASRGIRVKGHTIRNYS